MGSTADAITRQWFKEVWDEGREEAIDRLAHAEVKAHGLSATEMIGTEAFKQVFQAFRDALGDLEIR